MIIIGAYTTRMYRPTNFPQLTAGVCTWVAFGTSCMCACKYLGNYGRYGIVYYWEPIGKWPGKIEW